MYFQFYFHSEAFKYAKINYLTILFKSFIETYISLTCNEHITFTFEITENKNMQFVFM